MPAERAVESLESSGTTLVYLALDGDDAGRRATQRLVCQLAKVGLQAVAVDLPDGSDLSDCLVSATDRESWLANLLADFESVADRQVDSVSMDLVRERLAA
jgi:DNA primase